MTDNLAQKAEPTLSAKERILQALGTVDGITDVEQLIRSKLTSEAPKLHEVSSYLVELGGKRMRPILSLLCFSLFSDSKPGNQIIDVSAGIELIHAATLLHDDIIDKSPRRRNQTSPYLKYGVPATLLSGDFLLVRAFSLCARLDRFIIDETEKACIELTEGEILETPLFEEDHTLESYLTIAKKKTAALFRLASVSGSHLALLSDESLVSEENRNNSDQIIEHMSAFGEAMGISFQIIDDILDVIADENLLGKKSGVDLIERKPTAVNILWLESGAEEAKELLKEPVKEYEDSFLESSLTLLRTRDKAVIDKARELARKYTSEAEKHLNSAAKLAGSYNSERLEVLRLIIEYTLSRIQ